MRLAQCIYSMPVQIDSGVPWVLPDSVESYVWMSGCASTQITFKSLYFCKLARTEELETEWSPPSKRGLFTYWQVW